MSLRERNRRRNMRELAEVSLRRFLQDGFDETTIDAIAHEAGISSRTFFRYFPTKEGAFFVNQEARLARFKTLLEQPLPAEPRFERVTRVCLEMAADFMADRDVVLQQYQIILRSKHLLAYDLQLDLQWEEAIHRTLAGGSDDPDQLALARVQAGAILGVIRAELRHWFRTGCSFDIVERGKDAFALLTRPNLGAALHDPAANDPAPPVDPIPPAP